MPPRDSRNHTNTGPPGPAWADPGRLSRDLVTWYRRHRRDLPWRRTRDPYRIWISEVMLQQTTVKTVVGYYEAFLAAFPTVAVLAGASEQEVLARWAGLGYYRRARNMLRAAREVMARHEGVLPAEPGALRDLPGIGEYTTGAILSIAHDLPLPVVDGNVIRVISRIEGLEGDPASSTLKREVARRAREWVPARAAGDHNQALMELGATLCTPSSPSCDPCPVRDRCRAHATGRPQDFPGRSIRPAVRREERAAVVIAERGRFLMLPRTASGLLEGFWELPDALVGPGAAAEGVVPVLEARLGIALRLTAPLPVVRHSVLDRRIVLRPWTASRIRGRGRGRGRPHPPARWVSPAETDRFPISTMSLKVLHLIEPVDGGLRPAGAARSP